MAEEPKALFKRECLCKRVVYEITAPARFAGYCHCANCREFSGADNYPLIAVDPKSFRYTKGSDNITSHSMSAPTAVREYASMLLHLSALRPRSY